ncbi:putative polygalacturonase, partial [Mucuna pruriens]
MNCPLGIKRGKGGSGYVRGVRFQNVRVENVSNPIIIDQFYCDSPTTCQNQGSAVEISEVMYQNISGTTMSGKAIKFDCSDTVPCSNLVLSNVDLEKEDGTVETYCHSAQGFPYGVVHPSADCLSSNDKISQVQESTIDDVDIRHTEL